MSKTLDDPNVATLSLNEQLRRDRGRPFAHCVMSIGRLAFTENMFCNIQSLAPLGILTTKTQGAFWGQCITRALENALRVEDYEWLMFMDYDTVFLSEDIEELIRVVLEHPEIDAIAPLQMHRLEDRPLVSIKGDDGQTLSRISLLDIFDKDCLKIATAHMGAVMIKTDKLRALSKPWFWSSPDPSGGWDEGRVDEDTYFWRKWEAEGNSLYLANHVAVGHCELMIRWPNRRWKTVHQHPHHFWTQGKPADVWR